MKVEFSQDQNYEIVEGRLRFSIDNVIRVERQSLFFNYCIYEKDISGSTNNFSLPLEEASYKIYTHKKGMLRLGMSLSKSHFFERKIFFKKVKPWISAFLIHVFFLLLTFVFLKGSYSFRALMTKSETTHKGNEVVEERTSSSGLAVSFPVRLPYSGQSIWKIVDSMKLKPLQEEKLSMLLKQEIGKTLAPSSTVFTNKKGAFVNFKVRSEVNIGKLANEAGLKRKDEEREFSQSERVKAELELRNLMDQLQQQMRSFYGKVLQKDPSFNTRVIISARVSHAGSLESLEVSPQGHSSQQNLLASELSDAIRNNLSRMSVPSALAGYKVRREFVFWK